MIERMFTSANAVLDEGWEPSPADIVDYLSWSAHDYDLLDDVEPLDDVPAPDEADALLGLAVSFREVSAWAQASEMEALAAFANHTLKTGPNDLGFNATEISEYVVDEISCALSITKRAADMRLTLASQLTGSLPATLAAWKNGLLDWSKVSIIAERTMNLTAEQAGEVETRVLAQAAGKTSGQLRRLVEKTVISVDPEGANARHESARHNRAVRVNPGEDGMSTLQASLSAEDAALVYATLSLIAKTFPKSDPRTMDQRRADTLVDLITGRTVPPRNDGSGIAPTDPGSDPSSECDSDPAPGCGSASAAGERMDPGRRPGKPLAEVVINAATLLGLDDQPAELVGHGPIPADLARRIAADATWRRILTDPVSGTVLDYGRSTYRPPAALADYVRARDRVCRFPTCQTPASRSDLDHQRSFRRNGGETKSDNLWALCRHHHRLKDQHTGWIVTGDPSDLVVWTSPLGRRYESRPYQYQDDPRPPLQPPEPPAAPETSRTANDPPPF